MRRGEYQTNKGYTMVEFIIVIAIIGILSALSLVTWNAVNNANYQKAVSTFESELSTLRTTTMAQDSRLAMRIYYDATDETYYIERGYIESNVFITPSAGDPIADLDYFKYTGTSNPIKVMKRGSIEYMGDVKDKPNGVVIHFNKSDGSVDEVYGSAFQFSFFKRNGDLIANVKLNKDTGTYKETY